MPVLYDLDLKDYREDAPVAKCASVKVIVILDDRILLRKSAGGDFYEVPWISFQPGTGGLGEHAVRLAGEMLDAVIGAEPVNVGQGLYKRRSGEDPGTAVKELYNYMAVPADEAASVRDEDGDLRFFSFEDAFADRERDPGLPELAYAETAVMKRAAGLLSGELEDGPRPVPEGVSIDEPVRIAGTDYPGTAE